MMLEKVDDSQSLFALLHFLFLCSNDLIPCDMYLTLPNAFYETYVVTVVSFLVVLLLSAGFQKHVRATGSG